MKTSNFRLLSLAITSILLTACATTSPSRPIETNQSSAKDTLGQAVQSQLRSSFGYETQVHVSHAIRRENLANATPAQRNAVARSEQCENTHDQAFMTLLKKAKADNVAVSDERYDNERERIKSEFLACRDEREKALAYQPFDFKDFYEQSKQLNPQEQAQAFERAIESHLSSQTPPEIDTTHTALDAKKAELLQEYLIRPTSIRMVGSYQPMQGKFTALPVFDYTTKNVKMMMNQPIYIDLKAGNIYLWADNFALLNSEFLDTKLGNTWHNKWLYVPINDGSLPPEFAQDLIKAYINAKKESFLALPDDGFGVVNSSSVTSLPFIADNLPSDKIALITSTPTIIKNNINEQARAYSDYVFADTLFQEMSAKYPVLTLQMPDFYEREIIEGESVIHVVNAEVAQTPDDNTADNTANKEIKWNSELLMRLLFAYLQRDINLYYVKLETGEPDKAVLSDDKYTPATHYGVNQGKISWVHQRYYMNNNNTPLLNGKMSMNESEPVLVDIFTQIFPNAKHMGEFSRLPTASQTPTAQNSINLFTYQDELRQRIKETGEVPPVMMKYWEYFGGGSDGATDEYEYDESEWE